MADHDEPKKNHQQVHPSPSSKVGHVPIAKERKVPASPKVKDDEDDFNVLKVIEARQRLNNGAVTASLEPVFRSEASSADGAEEKKERKLQAAAHPRIRRRQGGDTEAGMDDDIDIMKIVRARADAIHLQEESEAAAASAAGVERVAASMMKGLPPTAGNIRYARPGAYEDAPGVDPHRTEDLRFSLVGRRAAASMQDDDDDDEEAGKSLYDGSELNQIREGNGESSNSENDDEEGGHRTAVSSINSNISNTSAKDRDQLIVAKLVTDSILDAPPESMPLAEELDGSSQHTHITVEQWEAKDRVQRKKVFVVLGIVILVVTGAATAIALLYGDTSGDNSSTSISTPKPTRAPKLSQKDYLWSLLPDYTVTEISDVLSPQFLASEWSLADPYFANRTEAQIVQRFALAAFFFATGGIRWVHNTNWLSYNHSVCEWFSDKSEYAQDNVHLLADLTFSICPQYATNSSRDQSSVDWIQYQIELEATVAEIYLGENNLKGSLPEELYLLTGLQTFEVTGNQIEGTLSSRIGQLRDLTLFSLNANDVHGTLPSEIGLASSLNLLYLVSNEFDGTIPTEIGLLPKLDWLLLDENKLTGALPSELGLISDLTIFYADENKLTGPIPSELGLLSRLLALQLQHSGLSGPVPTELGLLSNLEQLYLYENLLTSTVPSELGHMSLIWEVFIGNCLLTGTIPTQLGLLENVEFVWLNDNLLSGSVPPEMGRMNSVAHLVLHVSALTGSLPSELGLLTHMESLSLHSNQLSGPIPSELGLLPNTTLLYLEHNNFSGTIFSEIGLLQEMELLLLHSNQLSGPIPSELGLLPNLTGVGIKNNTLLSGTVPPEWCNFTYFDCTSTLCGCSCPCP